MDAQVRAFGADYTTLLAGIRTRAGSPRIVVLNVPNPAGLPYLAGASLAQRQAAQRIAVAMTKTVVNPLLSSNIVVVDLMCDSRSYIPSNYSSDGLHPNDAGYAYIASRSRARRSRRVISGAAEQLLGDDDRAVNAARALSPDAASRMSSRDSTDAFTRELPPVPGGAGAPRCRSRAGNGRTASGTRRIRHAAGLLLASSAIDEPTQRTSS